MPNGCPAHDLDRHATVLVNGLSYTARLVCETWHDTAAIREEFNRVIAGTLQRERGQAFWVAQRTTPVG